MVALGWGVVRDDLGATMNKINCLGASYVAVALVQNVMTVVAYTEVQVISKQEDQELFDIASILSLVVFAIGVIFCLWIIDSLNSTMEYLENMNQVTKLQRYLRLRTILLFAILFAVGAAVFGLVDSYDQGIVEEDQQWQVKNGHEFEPEHNSLFLTISFFFCV